MTNYLNILKNIFSDFDTNQLVSKYQNAKNAEIMKSIFTVFDGLDSWNEKTNSLDNVSNLSDGKISFSEYDLEFNIKKYLLDNNGDISQEKSEKLFGEKIKVEDIKNAFEDIFLFSKKSGEENKLIDQSAKKEKYVKALKDSLEFLNSLDLKFISTSTSNDIYDFIKENPNIRVLGHNFAMQTMTIRLSKNKLFVFDKEGLYEEIEVKDDDSKNQKIMIVNNKRNNIVQTIYADDINIFEEQSILEKATKVVTDYYDNNDNLIKTVTTEKGILKDFPTITTTTPDNKTVTNQYASYDTNNGAKSVQRELVSPDGTKTEYFYEETGDNIKILNYKITDKNGKVILDRKNTFQQISKNKFISSVNDKCYEIKFKGERIIVLDKSKNKQYKIDLRNKLNVIILDEKADETNDNIVLKILKSIPGNLLAMMNSIPLESIFYNGILKNNGEWNPKEKTIEIGQYTDYSTTELNKLIGVYLHEFGHYLDSDIDNPESFDRLSTNPEVVEIFQEELKNLKLNTTSTEQANLSHLIGGNALDLPTEKAAETNMLLYSGEPGHGFRATLFAQYFPRTIAKIAELFDKKETEFLSKI